MGDNAVLQDSSSSHSSSRGTTARDGTETQQMQITIDSQSFVNLGQLMGSRVSVSTAVGGPPSSMGGAGTNNALGASVLSDGSHDSEGLRDFDQIFHPAGSTSSTWSGHELGPHEEDAMDGADGDGDDEADEDDDDDGMDDDDSVLPALPPRSPAPASPTGSALSSSPSNSSSSSRPFKSTLAGFGDDLTTASSAGGSAIAVAGSVDDDFPDNQGEVIGALHLDSVAGGDASCQRKTVTGIISSSGNHQPHDRDSKKAINNGSKQHPSSSSAEDSGVLLDDSGLAVASPTSIQRESWLHVPLEGSDARPDGNSSSGSVADDSANDGPAETKNEEQASSNQEHTTAAGGAGAGARRAVSALGECGDCLACGMEKAVALATPPLQHLSRLVKLQVEAGVEACARAHQAAVKAVDNVPQAPVRMWLSRIAGSLVLGAILGGTAAYYALPRFVVDSVSTCAGTDATSPWWNTPAGGHGESASGGAEQSFGERLNKALFAARAGESVAQQSLLEEVRTILAATGKSGGISAEQILRQFNAKRFAEASKAWSAAEGIAGSDPLDPLFFAPPSTPIYTSAAPSSASQNHRHQHSDSHKSAAADCAAGGGSGDGGAGGGGTFCSADGVGTGSSGGGGGGGGGGGSASRAYHQARGGGGGGEGGPGAGRQNYRRSCGGGGWVC